MGKELPILRTGCDMRGCNVKLCEMGMTRLVTVFTACIPFAMCAAWADIASDSGAEAATEVIRVNVTRLGTSTTEKCFGLVFQVKNTSKRDVWICDNMNVGQDIQFEAYFSRDDDVLKIRRRSAIGAEDRSVMRNPPLSCYARIGAGQSRRECLLLPLPFQPQTIWASDVTSVNLLQATELSLTIGYCDTNPLNSVSTVGVANTEARRTQEEFFVYEHELPSDGEHVLRLAADGLHIPCDARGRETACPDLSLCTRIDISWHPSALDYFFPHPDQQLLLSAGEIERLSSRRGTTLSGDAVIKAVARDISRGASAGIIIRKSKGHVTCFRDGELVVSFDMYHNAVVTQDNEPLAYGEFYKGGFPSLREFVPEIKGIELRVQCANNLGDLRNRLRHYVGKKMAYPAPSTWTDEIVRQYAGWITVRFIEAPFMCPSASAGRCHYAMNPSCEPNSPGDTVLLFETKAGWNQHGGPELFTFDNHDPKGGCVLLNDGTVRFIRTEEELHALRWKQK